MTEQNVDLVKLFSSVSKTLSKNQEALNQADEFNHDHGDNMVKTFKTISSAMKTKQDSDPATMLSYAAQALNKKADSGSAQLYAQGLQAAAQQFQGKSLNTESALSLLQTLLSAGQPAQTPDAATSGGMGGLIGSLLGGGGSGASPQAGGMGDLIGSLLGGATGGSSTSKPGGLADGIDIGDLITGGMAFFQSKQQGKSTLNALIEAFVAGSGMGNEPHRQKSTLLVAEAFMGALGKMSKAK